MDIALDLTRNDRPMRRSSTSLYARLTRPPAAGEAHAARGDHISGAGGSGSRPRARHASATTIPTSTAVAPAPATSGGACHTAGISRPRARSPISRDGEIRPKTCSSKGARPTRNSAGPPRMATSQFGSGRPVGLR